MKASIRSMAAYEDYDDELFITFPDPDMYDTTFDKESLDNLMIKISSILAKPPDKIDSKHLSRIWRIKESEAEKVLDQSTILLRKGSSNPLSRRHPTNDRMLRYRRLQSYFSTDTFFSSKKARSLRGFTSAQLFVSDKGYFGIFFIRTKG